jgi:hypothetical protein
MSFTGLSFELCCKGEGLAGLGCVLDDNFALIKFSRNVSELFRVSPHFVYLRNIAAV